MTGCQVEIPHEHVSRIRAGISARRPVAIGVDVSPVVTAPIGVTL
jgi:hypothetical protein